MTRKSIAATGKRQHTETTEVIMLEVIVFVLFTQIAEGFKGDYVNVDGEMVKIEQSAVVEYE